MNPAERTPDHVARQKAARAKGWQTRRANAADPEHTIVAEVTTTWINGRSATPEDHTPGIAQRFEYVIQTNAKRGYILRDWQLSRVMSPDGSNLNETIVAVFERRRAP